jgi:hypothetical protein
LVAFDIKEENTKEEDDSESLSSEEYKDTLDK